MRDMRGSMRLYRLVFVIIAGSLFFARKNQRLGRIDRRGARRLATFVMSAIAIGWLFGEHHVATFWELYLFAFGLISFGLLNAAAVCVIYIALEPAVRRRRPQMLVSWTRLLSGEWRDPLIGRDVLVGCTIGVALACLERLLILAPTWFGRPLSWPPAALVPLAGTGSAIARPGLCCHRSFPERGESARARSCSHTPRNRCLPREGSHLA